MLNEELITKLSLDVINEMPYNDLARLTKYFAEEQVRAILAKSNDIEAQRLIFEGIKKKYEQWDGEKNPLGVNLRSINKNMFGVDSNPQFPEYFDKIDLSLKYGFIIGKNNIFPTSYVSPSATRNSIAETNNPKTPDTTKLETRIKELEVKLKSRDDKIIKIEAENEDLKEQLEECQSQPKNNEIPEAVNDEWLVELLEYHFLPDEREHVRDFIEEIRGKDDPTIADIILEWKDKKRISQKTFRGPLWRILHAAKLYNGTESNYNTALNRRLQK